MSIISDSIELTMAFVQEVESQTDRGAAILGASWVEEELKAAIQSFLLGDPALYKKMFNQSGPLSSFSSCIDLARALGMCSSVIYGDLHRIRQIRNDFAHSILDNNGAPLSFQSFSQKDKCLALKCVEHEKITDPRYAFIRACAILNSDFSILRFHGIRINSGGEVYAKIEKGY